MNHIIHERPGVYSSYDASTIIRGGRAVRTIGVAAKSSAGTKGVPVTLTSYEAGLTAFGEDAAEAQGMSTILRLLFLGGASTVVAVAVDGEVYKDMTPAMLELSLLMGNALNRELSPWEKTQQAQRLKEALIRARDEDGLEIQGKLRDMVADLMNESSSGIARMDRIHNHAVPEIQEEFRKGNLNISAAYEASKLPEKEQKAIAKAVAEEGGMKAKEVTERAMKNQEGKDGRKNEGFSVVSKLDTDLQPQSGKEIQKNDFAGKIEKKKNEWTAGGGNIRQFKKGNRHQEILREWGRENVSLTVITQAVTEAMQKVSKLDTSEEWSDIEWAVFLTRAIMNRADCVSEEDLYLLHDIMIRCQEEL